MVLHYHDWNEYYIRVRSPMLVMACWEALTMWSGEQRRSMVYESILKELFSIRGILDVESAAIRTFSEIP